MNKTLKPAKAAPTVMHQLLGAARRLEDRLEAALAGSELSMAKFGVLSVLAQQTGPLSLSQLAARNSCVRSNMTQLVDRLESDGLVRRVDDPGDRRSVLAELTVLGRSRHQSGAAAIERVQAEFVAALAPRDRQALERVLKALR